MVKTYKYTMLILGNVRWGTGVGAIGVLILLGAVFFLVHENGTPVVMVPASPGLGSAARAEQYLLTQSTSGKGLGCGPPDDFDCGNNRYSGYMALASLNAYEQTGADKFLTYAIRFAMEPQDEPAGVTEEEKWYDQWFCNPPDDFDCGTGEVQAEMIQVFARLYGITRNPQYLRYAEGFVNTMPSASPESCPDCSCGPPDDFDCGEQYVQWNYLMAYNRMYEATDDETYIQYTGELGKAWMDKSVKEEGPRIVNLFLTIHSKTVNESFLEHAVALGSELARDSCGLNAVDWGDRPHYEFDQSALIETMAGLFASTGDERYLECADLALERGGQCDEGICNSIVQQASMIMNSVKLYRATNSRKYLQLAMKFAEQSNIESVRNSIFGYTTSCEGFDCHDAEDNAFLAGALLELSKAEEHGA